MIPYGRQAITEADIAAVVAVLRSDLITQGPVVPRFEAAVAGYCGAAHGVAVASGTAALHLACLALGLGPGDRLWTSPISFVASANCGLSCGAEVDFVDIDPATRNLSVPALEAKLADAARTGRLPKVLVPVHFAGRSCAMAAIGALARRHGVRVVEDACHALGGRDHGDPVGACRHSDAAVFSFHPVKSITTGEGGMIVTNHAALAGRAARLRNHGITRDPAEMAEPAPGPWYYEQRELGLHARMTDLQAALGLSQLTRLDAAIARRAALAGRYDRALAALPLIRPTPAPGVDSAHHLYVVEVEEDAIGRTRGEVFAALRDRGIGVNVHYIPIHLQPVYRARGFGPGACPAAEAYYRRALTLPLYPGLGDDEQDQVIAALAAVCAAPGRHAGG